MTAVVTVVFTSCPTRGGQQRNQFSIKPDFFVPKLWSLRRHYTKCWPHSFWVFLLLSLQSNFIFKLYRYKIWIRNRPLFKCQGERGGLRSCFIFEILFDFPPPPSKPNKYVMSPPPLETTDDFTYLNPPPPPHTHTHTHKILKSYI